MLSKIKKAKKRTKEAEKVKGISNKDSRILVCDCGKEVEVHNYKCEGNYTCIECRCKKEPFKFKNRKDIK